MNINDTNQRLRHNHFEDKKKRTSDTPFWLGASQNAPNSPWFTAKSFGKILLNDLAWSQKLEKTTRISTKSIEKTGCFNEGNTQIPIFGKQHISRLMKKIRWVTRAKKHLATHVDLFVSLHINHRNNGYCSKIRKMANDDAVLHQVTNQSAPSPTHLLSGKSNTVQGPWKMSTTKTKESLRVLSMIYLPIYLFINICI